MNSDRIQDRSIPILFFITTIIAYGVLLPQTGFYWDDWPFVWIAKFLGPAEFFPAFANIRPFLAPIFFVTTSLIPPDPLYWQIFMLVIRFASGLLAWFLFSQVWPQRRREALVASLLFLIFPGYSQHWVAFTHINQEWIAFLFYLLSFGLTARALRKPDHFRAYTFWALVFMILGVFPTEYFGSLEPLRLLFIWVIASEELKGFKQKLLRAFKLWLPYLIIWLVNAAWLAYFFFVRSFGSYDVEVVADPISALQILGAIADALWKSGFYVWAQVLVLVSKTFTAPSSILTILLVGASFILLVFYLSRIASANGNSKTFPVSLLLLGTTGILLGRLPSFAAGLPLTLQSSNDRFMISMMIGGSLFIMGIVELLIRNDRGRIVVYALLIALGIGQQFFNANIFRRDWLKQQEFYSQLAWRIPGMEPGTLLMTDQMPMDYETDLSLTAPINWIYAPDYTSGPVPYALLYTELRLGRPSLPSLKTGEQVNMYLRTASFAGSTSQAIVIHMPQNGCLRVLGSEWGDEITHGGQSMYLVDAIPLSKPGLIKVDEGNIPRLPFLPEGAHDWCYYYTKAELARQKQDWQQVSDLLCEATSLGYRPGDPFEWLVFIEGNAMTGDIHDAKELSEVAYQSEHRTRKGLCQVWTRVHAHLPEDSADKSETEDILLNFKCSG